MITYGFPCQPFSTAGRQEGFNDSKGRGNLFFDALRIIKHCKPKIAIAENVKNLTSDKFKKEFNTVLNALDEAGYSSRWALLDGRDYSMPQHRERVLIVSIRKDIDNGIFEFPAPVELTKCMNDYNGWLKWCNSYRLRQKYIEPIQPSLDRYYNEVVKSKSKRKVQS